MKKILIFICSIAISACDDNQGNAITLYKNGITKGAGILTITRWGNSANYAREDCETLRALYEKEFNEKYYCSSTIFKEHKPKLIWEKEY